MRRLLLALALLLTLTYIAGASGEVTLSVNAYLDTPYLVEQIDVRAPPLTSLAINLSGHVDKLVYAVASAGGSLYEGEVEGEVLRFRFGKAVGEVNIVLVLKCANATGRVLELEAPLPLAPLGYASNYTLVLWNLPSEPNVVNSTISLGRGFSEKWTHYLRGNGSSPPGGLGFVKLYSYITTPSPIIARVNRTIVIEEGGKATIIDNFTLVGLLNEPSGTLVLSYPSTVQVEAVEGPLGPYPPNGYSVKTLDEETRVTIKLRAPPYRAGDRAYVWVKLRAPLRREGARYEIPAFLGVGHYIPLLKLRVKVRGRAEFQGLNPLREWVEGDYRVYDLGSFKLVDEKHAPALMAIVELAPQRPPLYIVATLILAAAAAAGYFLRGRRLEGRKEAVVEALETTPELVGILEERRRLIESLMDNWRRLEEGKLSRHAYRQIYSRLRRREEELRRRAVAIARELPQAAEKLSEFDKAVSTALSRLSRMEELLRRAGRGLIEKREYKRRVTELEREFDDALRVLEEVIEGLRG
ncbi:MAG: hypothetical protein DRK00_01035 [Thermoprotei archaeon]|nr:MAG: hypothetical protein DRK00_01035 [Thermoprotei archaeon]